MSRKLMCPNGHHWDAAGVPGQSTCPVCGTAATLGDFDGHTKTGPAGRDLLPPPPAGEDAAAGKSSPQPAGSAEGSLPEQFGRYRILRSLGQGGMGAVYLAHDTQLDRRVALKVPHFSTPRNPRVFERFTQEARAAATLDHPNICSVYDVGEIDGVHYLTMAYVEGQTLAELIRGNEKPLGQQGVADLIRKLALALDEAHSQGIVHRDLKPANVMINQRFEPVIMDFGLARRDGGGDSQLTAEGAVMGTPAYMSPEQVAGDQQKIGPATDIYALGAMMYEMLTGRLPFTGSVGEVFSQIATQAPPPLSGSRPDVDPQLAAICLKALNKPVEERFASMAELAAALGDYLDSHTSRGAGGNAVAAPSAGQTAGRDETAGGDSMQLAAKLLASLAARIDAGEISEDSVLAVQRRRPWWVWAIAASAVTALIVLAMIPFLKSPAPQKAPVVIQVEQFTQYVNAVYIIDGREFTREELQGPVELPIGRHELLVKRDDKVIARKSFEVTQDHAQRDSEPISVTPEPVDPPVVKRNGPKGNAKRGPNGGKSNAEKPSLPRFPVDATLEVWSRKYSSSRTNPLHSRLLINGEAVDTFEDKSQWTIAKRLVEGRWNEFTLLTTAQQPIKGANHLSFSIGPVAKTANGERMSPVIWNFHNGEGWSLKGGRYTHPAGGNKPVTVLLKLYYGNLKRESREPKGDDYVVSSVGASRSRNPSVTATLFVNGTPLTTFCSAPRQAVITDLLKQGLNSIKLVTHPVKGSLADSDIHVQIAGPALGSKTARRGLLWLSALTGWRRDAKGRLVNAGGGSDRFEREITFFLPVAPGTADNTRLPKLAVFARRDSQYAEAALHSEIRVQPENGRGRVAARFASDSSESLDGVLKQGAWNAVTIRTVGANPPPAKLNGLAFYFGTPQRRSGGAAMPRALWVFRNDAAFQQGKGWELKGGRLVNGTAQEVEHTYHVYLGDPGYENQKPQQGDYALICGPPTRGRVPSVTATAYVNGTPVTTFAGAQRTVILRPPLIKKGVNVIRLVTRRIDNSRIDGDFQFVIGGPAATNAPRYPRIKEFSALKGWVRNADGRLVNPEQPDSDALVREYRFQVE